MKKILFTLIAIMIIGSCATEKNETTFIVKFKDGTEIKTVGTGAGVGKNGFYVYHTEMQTSVFAKDEVLYVLKEQ